MQKRWIEILVNSFIYAGIGIGLYLLSRSSFLFYHTLVEMLTVSVALAIFLIVWNSRKFVENNYLVFIGIAYLFIPAVDFLHTLAYKGMGVFEGYGANPATQLWIAARYMQSLSLLIAPLFLKRRLRPYAVFGVYAVLFVLVSLSILVWDVFPTCYDDDAGRLTPFKQISELINIVILLGALGLLVRSQSHFDPRVLRWLSWSIVLTIGSEAMFTQYRDVFGVANATGHYLKLIAFYFIYKSLIETGLQQPYELLFRNLKQSEQDLARARDELDERVRVRTAQLTESEQRFRLMAETIPDVFWLSTPGLSKMIYVSPAYEEIWGRKRDSLYESGRSFTEAVHPQDKPHVLATLSGHAQGSWNLEYRIVRPDGAVRWIADRGFPIHDEEGTVKYMTGIAADITTRKEMEGTLRNLTSELVMAEERERRAIATELHDSVAQILAFLKIELGELQRHGGDDEEASDIIGTIRSHLDEAIRQTRTLTFEISPPELYSLGLGSALEELAQRFSEQHAIPCSVEIQEEAPELDEQVKVLLYRSVRELLINAVKHARCSNVWVFLCRTPEEVQITVQDDGVGFDSDQLDTAGHRKSTGYGLFSVCQRLTQMGGRVDIDSGPEKGTTITLVAPLACEPAGERSETS